MFNREFVNEKVSNISVFDIFEGDLEKTIAKLKHVYHTHGNGVSLKLDEQNPYQINVFKNRLENEQEFKARVEQIQAQRSNNIEFKKRELAKNYLEMHDKVN